MTAPTAVTHCVEPIPMTTLAALARADQLAAELREARTQHDGEVCDAFNLCDDCQAKRAAHAGLRIPEQRRRSA